MTKWSYRRDYVSASPAGLVVNWDNVEKPWQDALHEYGEAGWELASAHPWTDGGSTVGEVYLWRKAKPDPAEITLESLSRRLDVLSQKLTRFAPDE